MNKQFVTYEIALKLKELGFDEKCFALYDAYQHNRLVYLNEDGRNSAGIIKTNKSMEISSLAPLWQQVTDWLDKKYNLFITLALVANGYGFYIHIHYNTTNKGENYGFYPTLHLAREQAILKAIELIKEKQ